MKRNSIFLAGLIVIAGYCLRPVFLFAGATVTPWEKYVRAAELFQTDSTAQQIKALCRSVRKETDDPVLFSRATLLLSDVYQQNGKLEKVHQLLQQIYTGNFAPQTIMQEAKLRDGQTFLVQKKHLLAKKLFSDVAKNTSSNFLRQEGRLALAWQYADDIQWTLCDSVLSEIVNEQPAYNKDERMLVLRARQNIAKVNPNAAIALLKNTHGRSALRYLAQAYEQAGKPILAVGVYNKIHDLYQNSPEAEAALFQGAEVFMKSGDWIAARSELQRFLDVYPKTSYLPMINFRLGWIAFKLGKYDEALNYFQNVSTDITESYIAFMEAECYRSMGKKDAGKLHEAVLKYNHIIALYPNSVLAPLAELRMALTLLDEGEKKDAIISLRQFLSLHPKDNLASAATFLLATHVDEPKKFDYFTTILSRFPGQDVFDAALAALQKQDYDAANYQNRH